MNIDMYKIFDD